MLDRFDNARILIYCHDTLGLGHLRRCRTIAQSLVARYKGLSILIVSGSPIIGAFEFRARVDFVRVPGVIKLRNGEYSSLSLDMDISQVVELRASIIHHTAKAFRPDLFQFDQLGDRITQMPKYLARCVFSPLLAGVGKCDSKIDSSFLGFVGVGPNQAKGKSG